MTLIKSQLYVCVPCVHYDDFLSLTLPTLTTQLANVTVVTHPDDTKTIDVARGNDANVLLTESWGIERKSLDKGAAINAWLNQSVPDEAGSWILTLDADIYLPPGILDAMTSVDANFLYSARRRLCRSPDEFAHFLNGTAKIGNFTLDEVPIKNGRAWGSRPTTNPAGLQGYFQLWHTHGNGQKMKRYEASGSAKNYDVEFALRYEGQMRRFIERYEVLHLGETKRNWFGRVTPRW